MNRNTKIVLLVSLFALVCLAILWGRWFPDNQELDGLTVLPQGESSERQPMQAGTGTYTYPIRKIVIGEHRSDTGDPGEAGRRTPPPSSTDTEIEPPANPTPPGDDLAGWRTHKVAANDKLWSLAVLYLGDGTRYKEILAANPDVDPKALKLNTVLKIPPRERGGSTARAPEVAPGRSKEAPPPSSGGSRQYTVRPGDTLAGIAKRELGSEGKWQVLAELNDIKPPQYTIKPGDQLKLPAR